MNIENGTKLLFFRMLASAVVSLLLISNNIAAAATTIEKRVAATADDAEERGSGSIYLDSSDLELVFDRSSNQTIGMRFTDLNIPREALIEKAYVQFDVDETNSGNTFLLIQGEYTGSAGNFTESTNDITSPR